MVVLTDKEIKKHGKAGVESSKGGVQYYKCNSCHRKFAGRDAPEGMRFATHTIGEAMGLFYDGLSLADISRHFKSTEGIYVDPATVW